MAEVRSRHAPVQRFRPTTGTGVGYLGLVLSAVAAVTMLATEPNLEGLRAVLGLAVAGVLIWAVLVRPRATAYQESLVLHHMFSDTHLPLARIDAVAVTQMMTVWVGGRRYACAGIGRSSRKLLNRRSRGPMAVLGLEQADDRMGWGRLVETGGEADYVRFVEARIEELARSARRDLPGEPPPVRRSWAVAELTVLGMLVAAFAVSLLVG